MSTQLLLIEISGSASFFALFTRECGKSNLYIDYCICFFASDTQKARTLSCIFLKVPSVSWRQKQVLTKKPFCHPKRKQRPAEPFQALRVNFPKCFLHNNGHLSTRFRC